LHEQNTACTLIARALHHHIECPILVEVNEDCTPGVRNVCERLDAPAHLAPPTPGARRRASWHPTCAWDREQKTHVTLCDQ
jgi:hypothetical protein